MGSDAAQQRNSPNGFGTAHSKAVMRDAKTFAFASANTPTPMPFAPADSPAPIPATKTIITPANASTTMSDSTYMKDDIATAKPKAIRTPMPNTSTATATHNP